MLQLKGITKVYGQSGENEVHALKGIDITFRKCEFVSILGPSGCGKTTMLNIIGGLDVASSGGLIFDGVSTKGYTDRDWDDYRNSKIGFVFQSYNLIPHLKVIDNVALALTISGVSGEERIQRAKEALELVGLGNQLNKLPNQLSGGQVQRVAIARAIVNSTPLLLADEPTGAIDSETSVQVMELLKEISKTRLVIMVTHNAELAEKYSTRIVRVLDGEIISDSDPYDEENAEESTELVEQENTESVLTIEEKEQDIEFTSVTDASEGEEKVYDETAESTESVLDSEEPEIQNTQSVFTSTVEEASDAGRKGKRRKKDKDKSKKASTMTFGAAIKLSWRNLISKRGRSILTAIAGSIGIICIAIILAINNGFNTYIEKFERTSLSKYPITVTTGEDSVTSMLERLQEQLLGNTDNMNVFEMLGSVDENRDMTDIFPTEKLIGAYQMFVNMMYSLRNAKTNDIAPFKEYIETMDPSWGDIKYDYSLNLDIYRRDVETVGDMEMVSYMKVNPLSENGILLPIIETALQSTGEWEEQFRQVLPMLDTFPYWDELVGDDETILAQYDLIEGSMPKDEHEIVLVVNEYNRISDLDAVALKELGVDVLLFPNKVDEYEKTFEEILNLEFRVLPASSAVLNYEGSDVYVDLLETTGPNTLVNDELEKNGIPIKISGILRPKPDLKDGCIKGVIGYTSKLGQLIMEDANNSPYVLEMKNRLAEYQKESALYKRLQTEVMKAMENGQTFGEWRDSLPEEELAIYNKGNRGGIKLIDAASMKEISESALETHLRRLNVRDLDRPSYIYIYASSVENKDKITSFVNKFNADADAKEKAAESEIDPETGKNVQLTYTNVVKCTDELDSIVHDMDNMINTITYILIAVALVSVLVTMFLIAIIMYISVQDRTREIGILRALGARKMDISNIFNVETIILGLISGVIGVIIAFILQFPGNAITRATLNLEIVTMAWWHPFVLIIGSMLLTLVAGLIPAAMAAKKQPVIALRTDG